MLEGSDKLARDAFVHSVKVFIPPIMNNPSIGTLSSRLTSLVLFYAFIINYNKLDTHYIT